MDFRLDIIIQYLPVLLKGTLLTIGISVVSILFGSILGLGIGFGKMAPKWYLRWPFHSYINFFRGTPLYVQILIVHFGVIPPIYGKTNALITAFVALSLNSAAYSAEIFRAGIQSIDRGQRGSYFTWDDKLAGNAIYYFTAGDQTDGSGFWQRIYCISKGLFTSCARSRTGNYVLEQYNERAIFADLGALFDGGTYLFHSHLFSQQAAKLRRTEAVI